MKLSYKHRTADVPLGVLRCLKRSMRWVRAAGCIVSDEADNMLLISRNGRWDLPKGKVEPGETLHQAALRETAEETGVECLDESSSLIIKTYHIYNLYGGWHLKQTSWFSAKAAGVKPEGKPQGEEGIAEVVWVTPDEWHRRLMHSYGTMKTIARQWQQSTT